MRIRGLGYNSLSYEDKGTRYLVSMGGYAVRYAVWVCICSYKGKMVLCDG